MEYSLYLHPQQSAALAQSTDDLIACLQQIDFLAVTETPLCYQPGEKLMDYITFLGCSPALQRGEIDSVIRLHHREQPFALGGESVVTLRYPGCQHPIQDAARIIRHFDQNWHCPQCDNQGAFADINWRRSAAVSTLFIEITAVFPKEAVPSDKLLDTLWQNTSARWNWFYSQSQPA